MTQTRSPGSIPPDIPLPDGVVTFLFTDIEGSTRLLEEHRDAMGPAMARHHEILAAVIEAQGGVVFETVGDAVYGAFSRPRDAIVAAVAIQRRLRVEPWPGIGQLRVRAAIHTGAVETRGRHYFGPALFECARMQSLAHGGQTLTSAATAALVAGSLTEESRLSPLGRHRLEDLEQPMEVLQVDAAGLPDEFPPLRTAERTPSNLPHETTSFVGRAQDLRRLAELIDRHRMVTLLGPGGTGKTRLALAAAEHQVDRFPDGVWLVELAPVLSPELVINELAETWGLRAGEGSSLDDVVRRYLASRHLLLVVDNCEHVRGATATILRDVLRTAPKVSVLATSRESLGVPGEAEYRVPTLPVPDSPQGAARSDAVRLFLDRMRMVRPDIEASEADLAAIVRTCRRLEGMPLGLELAAARIRTLSPTELADRLDTTFHTLGSAGKTALPHQRTLEATLDWSYDLLEPDEQAAFRRLSAFAGSFDLAGAEAVVEAEVDGADVLGLLESLVDKSLVLTLSGPVTRFRLLEPIRQYAAERLATAGEAPGTRDRHAAYFVTFLAETAPAIRGPEQMAAQRRIEADYDNVRVALGHLLERGDLERYLASGFDLFVYWMHLGLHVEGVATLLAGLERASADTDPLVRVKAWWVAAALGAEITDPASVGHAREGLAVAQATGDANLVGRMELQLGAAIRHATTDPAYLAHLTEGRRLLEEHPESLWWEPEWERGLHHLVLAAYLPADDEHLPTHTLSALSAFEEVGDEALLAATLVDSAGLLGQAEDEWIMGNLTRAVEILDRLRVPYWQGHALVILGTLLQLRGEYDEASGYLGAAAIHLEEMGDLNCWAAARRRQASADAARGEAGAARIALGQAMVAIPRLPMPEVDIPRSLDAAAEVLLASGRTDEAAYTLGRAMATELPVDTVLPRTSVLEETRDRIVERLGADRAAALMAEGERAAPDEALDTITGWLAEE